MSTTALQVVHTDTGEVVKTIDVRGKSERQIDTCEMGLLRNMSDDYHVSRVAAPKLGEQDGGSNEPN